MQRGSVRAGLKIVHWISPSNGPGPLHHDLHFTKRRCRIVVKSRIQPPKCLCSNLISATLLLYGLEKFHDLLITEFSHPHNGDNNVDFQVSK